jgi:hypothetical protein
MTPTLDTTERMDKRGTAPTSLFRPAIMNLIGW